MHHLLPKYYLKILSAEEAEKFELHLFECRRCQQELDALQRAAQIMQQDQDYYRKKSMVQPVVSPEISSFQYVRQFAFAALIFFIVGSAVYSWLSQPEYFQIAGLTHETELVRLKGGAGESEFSKAVNDFREKRYNRALTGFLNYLKNNPEDYQANYFTGLTHLAEGETQFLWYRRFDEVHTRKSIDYLQTAAQLAENNQFYREECLWLLGKAWLRLGEREKAIKMYQSLIDLPSPDIIYRESARQVLKLLESYRK